MEANGVDLAVVEATCAQTNHVRATLWSEEPDVTLGDKVFAVGNPVGLGWTFTDGRVSAFRPKRVNNRDVPMIQTQTPISSGNSGGGLYNEKGELVGINTAVADPSKVQNVGFAIRTTILEQLRPKGLWPPNKSK